MKIFANRINGKFLRDVLPSSDVEVDWIKAAIAYGSDASTLFDHSIKNDHRLDIWMRYDHTVPVAPMLLRKFLAASSKNIFCYLIPDVHHAKVIWWRGYGVYIGSANLTDRGWVTNFEVGIFLTEEELILEDMLEEIEGIFSTLESLEETFPLTEEIVQEQEELNALKSQAQKDLNKKLLSKRKKPIWGGPVKVSEKISAIARKKKRFIQEWENGLTILRGIAEVIADHRPSWVTENTPQAWQADQFLHAFYYNVVVDGAAHPFNRYHEENKSNPSHALNQALEWWSSQTSAPSEEDVNLGARAPTIRELLAPERILHLSKGELADVLMANHSSVDHISKIQAAYFGKPPNSVIKIDERVELFAERLWIQKNGLGESFPQALQYILYEGDWRDTPNRMFNVVNEADRRFAHLGINQLAELVGWARPEYYPPRNGRTSKALRALGYNVDVY
jgi:PLD-like domain